MGNLNKMTWDFLQTINFGKFEFDSNLLEF